MKDKILGIVKHWMHLKRMRSSWVDPITRKHTSIQYFQERSEITTQGLIDYLGFPEVIIEIENDQPVELIIPGLLKESPSNVLEELHSSLVRLVANSYDKTIISLLKTLPRDTWKDQTIGNMIFYSSPLDKDVLWVRYADADLRDYPFEVDLTDNVIAVKDNHPNKVSRAHVHYALMEIVYANKLSTRPVKKRRRRVARPRT